MTSLGEAGSTSIIFCQIVTALLCFHLAARVCAGVWHAEPSEAPNFWTDVIPYCDVAMQILVGLLLIIRWCGGSMLSATCFELSCWITKAAFIFWFLGNTCGLILPRSTSYLCFHRLYLWFLTLAFGALLLTIPLGRYVWTLVDEHVGGGFSHPWGAWTLVCVSLLVALTLCRGAASAAMAPDNVPGEPWYESVPPPFAGTSLVFPIIDGLLLVVLGGIYVSFLSMALPHVGKSETDAAVTGTVWARAHLMFLLLVSALICWHCQRDSPQALFFQESLTLLFVWLLLLSPLCFPWSAIGGVLRRHSEILLSAPTDVTALCVVSILGSTGLCYYGYETLNQSWWLFLGSQLLFHLLLGLFLWYLQHSQSLLCDHGGQISPNKVSQYLVLYMGLYLFVILEGLAPYEQGGLTRKQKKRAFALTFVQVSWLGLLAGLYLLNGPKS